MSALFALASCDSGGGSPIDAMPGAALDSGAGATDAAANVVDGGPICTPDAVEPCKCSAYKDGFHVCASDGLSFSECDCDPDAGP